MEKVRVFYVSQEILPFTPESNIGYISRHLPQGIFEREREIRVFMPKYGKINERRHQLHEVIRLSGMNMIIDDSDHPLIIKVASIPAARMQVYFIDNEEYFSRKFYNTNEKGKLFKDADERAIFFVKGVLETVKKLGWAPDIIHCHGWMSALMPYYVKNIFKDNPHFADTKVIYSAYEQGFEKTLDKRFVEKLEFDGAVREDVKEIETPNFNNLNLLAARYSDGVIQATENIDPSLTDYIAEKSIPFLKFPGNDGYITDVDEFYDNIHQGNTVLIEE